MRRKQAIRSDARGIEPMAVEELEQLFEQGTEAYHKDDLDGAEALFQTGLEKARNQSNERRTASFLNGLGLVCIEKGQFERARDFLESARSLRVQHGDTEALADCWNNLGLVDRCLGQFDKARDSYLRALAVYNRTVENTGTGKNNRTAKRSVANTLNNLALIYTDLGQFDHALASHQRALRIYQEDGDRRDIGDSLNNIGNVHYSLGQFDKAIACYTQTLQLYGATDHPQARARTLNNLANVYDSLGRFEQALEMHLSALSLKETTGNSQSIAHTLDNLGAIYQRLGRLQEARAVTQQALALRAPLGNQKDLAYSYGNLGSIYQYLGNPEQARHYHQKALDIFETLDNPDDRARELLGVGLACYTQGQDDAAQERYLRALALRERLGNPQALAECLDYLGTLHMRRGQTAEAERCFARGLRHLEALRKQVGEASQLGAVQQTLPRFYARYVHLRLQCNRTADALVLVERGRAQGLARQASQDGAAFTRFLSSEDAAQLRTKSQERTRAIRLLTALQNLPEPAEPADQDALARQRTAAEKSCREAERQYTLFRDALFARYPEYRRIQGHKPATFRQMTALARRSPDTLYLEWAVVDDHTTLLFALSHRDGLRCLPLQIDQADLRTLVETWRTALTEARSTEPKAAAALSSLLLSSLEKAGYLQPGRYHRLVVVPDGPLLDIPFAALVDGAGKRLVETYALSHTVSLGMLTWPDSPRTPDRSLLCVVDPNGGREQQPYAALCGGLGPLPYARTEARKVTRLFPRALQLTGTRARERRVKQEMGRFALLHFATHGVLVPSNGLTSWLPLAPEPTNSQEDGRLEAHEVVERSLSAQLAVLSACETGRGQAVGGEGLLGLAWAFRAAGCGSVVASQWRVDDAATARLMEAFYKALLAGQRKDEALRSAMLCVRRQYTEPYFWAAFQLMGQTDPLTLAL